MVLTHAPESTVHPTAAPKLALESDFTVLNPETVHPNDDLKSESSENTSTQQTEPGDFKPNQSTESASDGDNTSDMAPAFGIRQASCTVNAGRVTLGTTDIGPNGSPQFNSESADYIQAGLEVSKRIQVVQEKMQQISEDATVSLQDCNQEVEQLSREIQRAFHLGHVSQVALPQVTDPVAPVEQMSAPKAEVECAKQVKDDVQPAAEIITPEAPLIGHVQPVQQEEESRAVTMLKRMVASLPVPDASLENRKARCLVTIRRIQDIRYVRVENHHLPVAQIDGWACMATDRVRKGDLVVFCMIDSFLPPADQRFGHYSRLQTFQGTLGHRVKTMRFGSYPNALELQGQLYPMDKFPEINEEVAFVRNFVTSFPDSETSKLGVDNIILAMYRETDWAKDVNVLKWEEQAQAQQPTVEFPKLGKIPTRVFKTTDDCLNLFLKGKYAVKVYQESVKMDGCSMTVYFVKKTLTKYHDLNKLPNSKLGANMVLGTGRFGVCSKKADIHELAPCTFGYWKTALRHKLHEKLAKHGRSIAIQGELCGPGINQNREGLDQTEFFVYSMYDVATQRYINPRDVEGLARRLGLKHVPVLGYVKIRDVAARHADLRQRANQRPGEGLVFKCVDDGRSFKVHSTVYRLRHNC